MGPTHDPVDRGSPRMAALFSRCGKCVPEGTHIRPGREPDWSTCEGGLLRTAERRHPHPEGDQGAGALRPVVRAGDAAAGFRPERCTSTVASTTRP
eukprot:584388-Heterocapsa_arctica.AAC.1